MLTTIEIDTHTHTIASGHAFSTLLENAAYAKKNGLKGLVLTEHSPSMPCGPVYFYPDVYPTLPRELEGVKAYYGMELDILDCEGTLGLKDKYFRYLEFAIASFHRPVLEPLGEKEATRAALAALRSPYVDMLGHPGNPSYPVDIEAVVLETKRLGKLVEINNHSPVARKGSRERCLEFLRLCKRHEVPVALSSDAHFAGNVGRVERTLEQLAEADFPEELVINATLERFEAYLQQRKERIASSVFKD